MNKRAPLLIMLVVGLLGGGSYLIFGRDGEAHAAPPVAAARVAALVTIKSALPPGHLIRADDLSSLPWRGGDIPAAAIAEGSPDAGRLVGAVTRRAFVDGEMVVAGAVITPGDRGFLAAIVAPGKRAIAVSVDAASAAGGLIWPGDRVDVILTQEITGDGIAPARKVVSETLLSDARVLSSDQRLATATAPDTSTAAKVGEAGKVEPHVATTVTIEVTQPDAERVAVAAALGKLSLTLRASQRAQGPDTPGGATWAGSVSPALATIRPTRAAAPAAAPAAPVEPHGVRIFRGSQAGA